MELTKRKCIGCGKIMYLLPSRVRKGIKCCSYACKGKVSRGKLSGDKNPMWKGDNANYSAIHVWLRNNFGKANKCENKTCEGKFKTFHWAKIKGYAYTHNRMNFFMLCSGCHKRYDGTSQETRLKRSIALKGHKAWNNWENIPKVNGRFSA